MNRYREPLIKKPIKFLSVIFLVLAVCYGCDKASVGNLSPSSVDEPERAARAKKQFLEAERRNEEGEAEFYRSLVQQADVPTIEDDPDSAQDDEPSDDEAVPFGQE